MWLHENLQLYFYITTSTIIQNIVVVFFSPVYLAFSTVQRENRERNQSKVETVSEYNRKRLM